MEKYKVQARTKKSYRISSTVCIAIVAAFVCFAVFMAFHTFAGESMHKALFGIGYIVAAVLGLMYVIIRINSVFATYAAADDKNIYLKNWSNNFLPYNTSGKKGFASSFIPAKTKITEIPIAEISSVFVGTKNFIKRYARTNDEFIKGVRGLEHSGDSIEKKQIRGMDILYIETADGEGCYMPIVKFDADAVNKLLKIIGKINPETEIKSGSRLYKAYKKNNSEKKEN